MGNSKTMKYDFDQVIERRNTDSIKWKKFDDDVIPMWVADMDFVSAEPVIQALRQRVDHGIFGYGVARDALRIVIRERLERLYQWRIEDEELLFSPGLVTGLNVAYQAYAGPGDAVLIQPPVYFHFIKDPAWHGRVVNDSPLVESGDTYEIDFDRFEKSITPRTKLFVLCNPHNPAARVYTRKELEQMAEICLRHCLIICSDEIHCDLLYPGYRHIPIAALGPEVADSTVTLMAPSKTYNLAGLQCGIIIIKNPALQEAWKKTSFGIVPHVNIMGHVAALAAFKHGQEWLEQILVYLKDNRDFLGQYITQNLPGVRMFKMEATYLAWLDCRGTGIPGHPAEFFLREARVGLNDGSEFGKGGDGFVRLNFACPRRTLREALDRMAAALKRI
jgi:cysteine-S-conjugate beta-lyase